ncbi:hypothetical protein K7432_000718 [Basidiobolus ranarum]|uniref:PH domain-containing protein n=1 Tax=Basidiobolus ranarum TaxID=34480 RepID=A0ABR2WAT0_9FUNG
MTTNLMRLETLALLNGTKTRPIYSSDEASLSSPVLQGKRHALFQQYESDRKLTAPNNVAKELESIRDALNVIVKQRKTNRTKHTIHSGGSKFTYRSKINGLLESLDACLDKVVSESESSGPSTPADLGYESHDTVGSRKYSNASTNSATSEKSDSSPFFAWGSEFSHSPRIMRDPVGIVSPQIREVSLNVVYMEAILAGWLNKLRINNSSFFHRKAWKRRLLVLTTTHLYQFKSSTGNSMSTNSMEISASTTINICDKYPEKRWILELQSESQHPWYIQAESLDDLKTWLNSLRAAIVRAKYAIRTLPEVPLGNVYREMIRRTSANNVQTTRPRTPRPCKSMSHAQCPTPQLIQSSRDMQDSQTSHSRGREKPRIDISISQSPLFNDGLLANINCSPTKLTFSPISSKKPRSALPTVMEC